MTHRATKGPSDTDDTLLDRRASDRPDNDGLGFLLRRIQPAQLLAFSAMLAGALSLVGWRRFDAASRYEELSTRITRAEARVDSLSNRLRFTNYLQCVQLRKTDPASLPDDCAPIIERGSRP